MTDPVQNFLKQVAWLHASIDKLNYYQILGVATGATTAEIKEAFFRAATYYHPDRFRNADPKLRDAIYAIFKRMNEAYHTLMHIDDRKRYNEGLGRGDLRLIKESRLEEKPKRPEDSIRTPSGRQYYKTATQALSKGDLQKAKLSFQMALSSEGPKNEFLLKCLQDVQQAINDKKKKPA